MSERFRATYQETWEREHAVIMAAQRIRRAFANRDAAPGDVPISWPAAVRLALTMQDGYRDFCEDLAELTRQRGWPQRGRTICPFCASAACPEAKFAHELTPAEVNSLMRRLGERAFRQFVSPF
jgi:hypothetical protein